MARCPHCPARQGAPCDGERFARLCELAATRADYRRLLAGETPPPTLLDKAASFIGAAASHIAAGCPHVDEAEKGRRLAICGRCEHHRSESGTCGLCGCALAIKASWALEHCPDKPPRW